MMPEYKLVRLFTVLSSVVVLSGCSMLNFLNVDAVDDNVDYQKTASSIKALAIPPGFSSPGFDDTYTSVQAPSGSLSGQNNNSGSSLAAKSVQNSLVSTQLSSKPAQRSSISSELASKPAPVAPSAVSSGRGVSLGAALLAQSDAASTIEKKPARTVASRAQVAGSKAQVKQPAQVQVQKPATRSRTSGNPQVAMMRLKSGEPALAVNAPYARSWSSLAPILSSIGFQVTKKQSDQGIYTTRYQGKASANLEPGKTYLVLVAENASRQSFIGVANANGKPAGDPIANEVLRRLKAEFER